MSIPNTRPTNIKLFTSIDIKNNYNALYKKMTQEDHFNGNETLDDKLAYILTINDIQLKQNLINGLKFKYEYDLNIEKNDIKQNNILRLQSKIYDFDNKYFQELYFNYKCDKCGKLGLRTKKDVLIHYKAAHNEVKDPVSIKKWLIKSNIKNTFNEGYKTIRTILKALEKNKT